MEGFVASLRQDRSVRTQAITFKRQLLHNGETCMGMQSFGLVVVLRLYFAGSQFFVSGGVELFHLCPPPPLPLNRCQLRTHHPRSATHLLPSPNTALSTSQVRIHECTHRGSNLPVRVWSKVKLGECRRRNLLLRCAVAFTSLDQLIQFSLLADHQ